MGQLGTPLAVCVVRRLRVFRNETKRVENNAFQNHEFFAYPEDRTRGLHEVRVFAAPQAPAAGSAPSAKAHPKEREWASPSLHAAQRAVQRRTRAVFVSEIAACQCGQCVPPRGFPWEGGDWLAIRERW